MSDGGFMKKLLFIVMALCLSVGAFARPQDRRLEQRALQLAETVQNQLRMQLHHLSDYELRDIVANLNTTLRLIDGNVYTPVPAPVCNQMPAEIYQRTFVEIKDFAYSSEGPNLTSSSATQYAQRWTSTYPCSVASKYMADYKRLNAFAYSSSGLNYTSSSARQFAESKVKIFCSGMALEQEFATIYDFAYSSSGLNYTSQRAREYALAQIEGTAFSCRNF